MKKYRMDRLSLVISWSIGIVFLLTGLITLFYRPALGTVFITISLLLLPPIRALFYSITGFEISLDNRVIAIVIIVSLGGIFGTALIDDPLILKRENAQMKASMQKKQEANLRQFHLHKSEILQQAATALELDKFEEANHALAKYAGVNDADLDAMQSTISKAIRKANTKKLLAKVGATNDYSELKDLYSQLLKLNMDNRGYRDKLSYYIDKIDEEEKIEAVRAARKLRIESHFSAWDGSHINLEQLVKATLNDPDSYKHDETSYWDKGDHIIVNMHYRARNGFGGMVRGFIKAKASIDGYVIEILEEQ